MQNITLSISLIQSGTPLNNLENESKNSTYKYYQNKQES